MTKRYISLFLILALLPASLALPVMADETDDLGWIQLLDYGMDVNSGSNYILRNGRDIFYVAYDVPSGFFLYSYDLLIKTDSTDFSLSSGAGSMNVLDFGDGLYRVFGDHNASDVYAFFSISSSNGSFFEILSFKASLVPFSKYPLSYYGYVYDYSYLPIKETAFSGDGSSSMNAVTISPNAGQENYKGYVSRIYLSSWNAYDYISLNISLFSSSLASVKVELDGVSVPYEINTVESTDVLGISLYLLDILIDTRNLDRLSDSSILVDVSGMVNPTFTGNFTVRSCLGFVSVPSPSLWTHWFTNLQAWLSSGFSSIVNKLTMHQEALISAEKVQQEANRQLMNTISSNVSTWISNQTTALTNSLSTINSSIGTFRANVESLFNEQTTTIANWGSSIVYVINDWGQSVKDSIDALPRKIAEELKALIVPADGAVESMATKSEALVSDRFGGVFEGAQIVDNWAGQLQTQAATQVLAIPVVNMNILGSNFPIGGWEVDLIPEGFELIFESVKIIIDILATAAFVNGIKNRLERTLEG